MQIQIDSKPYPSIQADALVTYVFESDNKIDGVVAEIENRIGLRMRRRRKHRCQKKGQRGADQKLKRNVTRMQWKNSFCGGNLAGTCRKVEYVINLASCQGEGICALRVTRDVNRWDERAWPKADKRILAPE